MQGPEGGALVLPLPRRLPSAWQRKFYAQHAPATFHGSSRARLTLRRESVTPSPADACQADASALSQQTSAQQHASFLLLLLPLGLCCL